MILSRVIFFISRQIGSVSRKIKLFVRILLFQLMTHANFCADNEFPGGAAGSIFENPGGGTDIISQLKHLGIAFRVGQYQGIWMYFL